MDKIQFRRDTLANWASANPILAEGEIGYVLDDPNRYKMGDGVKTWDQLPFRGFDGNIVHETGSSGTAVMSQDAVTRELTKLESIIGFDGIVAQSDVMTTSNKSKTLLTGLKIIKDHKYTIRATADKEVATNLIGFYVAKSTGGNHGQVTVTSSWNGEVIESTFVATEDDNNASFTSYMGSTTEVGVICHATLLDADSVDERIHKNSNAIKEIQHSIDGVIAQSNVKTASNVSRTLATGLNIIKGHRYTIRATADTNVATNLLGFYIVKSTGDNHGQVMTTSNWNGEEIESTFTAVEDDTNASLTSYMGSATEIGITCHVAVLDADSINERTRNNYNEITEIQQNVKPRYLLNNVINVAASDSSETDKANADYVCDGVNDEIEINKAINNHGNNITVNLFKGTYYIDSFDEYEGFEKSALVVKPVGLYQRSVLLKGQRHYFNGTRIVVRESAFSQITDNDKIPSVFNVLSTTNQTGSDNGAFWYVSLQDLFISVPNGKNPCVIVNLQNAGCGEEKNLRISAFGAIEAGEYKPADYNPANIAPGLVGIRAFHGWTYGDTVRFDNICVWGCYHGFELGAEHMIVSCCRTRYNYCGWTFGSYYKDLKRGAFDHPITLINCCDEKSLYGPIFEYCGLLNTDDFNIEFDSKLQCITFIDWNMETPDFPAEELIPGAFCGTIQFSAGGGTYGNSKQVQFWKKGSGLNFKTINSSHAQGGSSSERKSYLPTYMQQYYDTDLKQLLIYDGENWVNQMGGIVV